MTEPSTNYALRGGVKGYERLLRLSAERAPDTAAFFDRIGLAPGWNCIDLGCGGGEVTFEIARRVDPGGSVLGIDLDEVKLDLARRAAAERGISNVEFRARSVDDWTEVSTFDLAYSRFLLQHLRAPGDLLRRMWGSLRPGGVLAVEDVDHETWACHPPNAGFAFFRRTLGEVIDRRGGDHEIGRKLYGMFRDLGAPDPEIRAATPIRLTPDGRSLASGTLDATADAIVAERIATRAEIDAALADLEAFCQAPGSLTSGPTNYQVFVRKPTTDAT